MESMIKKNIDFLKYLIVCTPKHRQLLIDHSGKEHIDLLSAICLNFLHERLPIKDTDIRRLLPYSQIVVSLSDKRVSRKQKKVLLVKQSAFLPLFLKTVLPVIAP